jgi:hypothetical protein
MVSIFKVKIFSLYTYLKKIQKVIFPSLLNIFLHMNLGCVLSKLVQKNLNYIIPREGEGASFNKKPIITVERTKKEDPLKITYTVAIKTLHTGSHGKWEPALVTPCGLHSSHYCFVIFLRVICLKNEKSIFNHPCHKTKKKSKLGPLFMCFFGTYI